MNLDDRVAIARLFAHLWRDQNGAAQHDGKVSGTDLIAIFAIMVSSSLNSSRHHGAC